MVKDIAIDAEGFGFDSRAGQVGHSVAKGLTPLRRFFGAELRRWTPPLVTRFGVVPRVSL